MPRRGEQPLTFLEHSSGGPDRIGRYQVQATLGVGGFARVLRAHDESLDDAVAIKVLAENWASDEEIRHRFLDEAKLLRRVRSDHLVTVHDIGELEDGRPYFVMEFADAGTLSGRLKSRTGSGLDPPSARALIEALADGLGALHAAGVVHRDVNPNNVLLRHAGERSDEPRRAQPTRLRPGLIGADEQLLIGDLGLAKDVVRSGSNAVSLVGGTANYVPPEQADPAGKVGPEADVFAATAVLWECLTGTPPPNPSTVSSAAAGLDEVWQRFFATGMAFDAVERYSSMEAWRSAALECIKDESAMHAGVATVGRGLGSQESPYLGLAAFQPEDAARFFGRGALIDELVGRLQTNRMLVVAGPSGSGKSSLVRAGLIPAVAAGAIPGSERWPISLLTPGSDPLTELAYQLSKLAATATQQVGNSVSAADLRSDPNRGRLLAELVSSASGGALIVIDQFEELFTQGPDRAGQQAVLDALAALVDPADSRVRLVLAVRADFYGTCASFPWLADKITENQVLVGPMTRPELREAVEEPARRAGLVIEAGVVDAVLDEGGAEPGTLPLVSHALAETWRRRRGSMLTLDGYRDAGGVSGAIAQTANALYDDEFDAEEREAVRRLMLRLVNPGEGTPDTRRSVPTSDLATGDDPITAEVAQRMTAARLLTASEDSIEIAHEALIRTWPRLRQWIEESRDDLRMRQHIARAAAEWEDQDRDTDLLYRGTPLESALDWYDLRPDVLEPSAAAFLEAGRQARDAAAAATSRAEAAARRRRLIAVSALSLLTAAAVVAGIAAIRASGEANARFSQSLAAQAFNLADDSPRLALALAVEAIARGEADSFEARAALVDATSQLADSSLAPAASAFAVGDALAIAASPDGALAAAGYRDGTVRLWRPVAGDAATNVLPGHQGAVNDVQFTPDGTRLVTASNDGTIRIWDVSDPVNIAAPRVLAEHDAIVWRIAVSPDGSSVASASEDGTVQIWDLATGAPRRAPLIEITRDFLSVAFSPDGTILLAGNGRGELHGWFTASGQPALEQFEPHNSDLWHIAFDPSGARFATSSSDGTVRLWSVAGEALGEPYNGSSENGPGIAFDRSGTLVVGTDDGRVGLWDSATERLELTPPGHGDHIIDVAASATTDELITLSTDQTVRAWTPPSGSIWTDLTGQVDGAYGVAAAPNGTIAAGDGAGTVRVYGPGSATGAELTTIRHAGPVTSLAFDDTGTRIVSGGADGTWWTADVAQGSAGAGPVAAHDGAITSIVWSGDSVITAGEDGAVRVWTAGGDLSRQLADNHAGGATALAVNGSRVASADRSGAIRVYDAGSGGLVGGPFQADDNTIWDLDFSPDGALLATASADEVVTVWDLESLEPLAMLTPHSAGATGVVFADAATIVSVDAEGRVRFWDVTLGRQLGATLIGHEGAIRHIDAVAEMGRFVTSGADGGVHVWNVLDLEVACAKAEGAFDAEQQRRYLDESAAVGCPVMAP